MKRFDAPVDKVVSPSADRAPASPPEVAAAQSPRPSQCVRAGRAESNHNSGFTLHPATNEHSQGAGERRRTLRMAWRMDSHVSKIVSSSTDRAPASHDRGASGVTSRSERGAGESSAGNRHVRRPANRQRRLKTHTANNRRRLSGTRVIDRLALVVRIELAAADHSGAAHIGPGQPVQAPVQH